MCSTFYFLLSPKTWINLSDCKFLTTMSKLVKIKVTPSRAYWVQAWGQPPNTALAICFLWPEIMFSHSVLLSILGKSVFESYTSFVNMIVFSSSLSDSLSLHFFLQRAPTYHNTCNYGGRMLMTFVTTAWFSYSFCLWTRVTILSIL